MYKRQSYALPVSPSVATIYHTGRGVTLRVARYTWHAIISCPDCNSAISRSYELGIPDIRHLPVRIAALRSVARTNFDANLVECQVVGIRTRLLVHQMSGVFL